MLSTPTHQKASEYDGFQVTDQLTAMLVQTCSFGTRSTHSWPVISNLQLKSAMIRERTVYRPLRCPSRV